MLMPACCCCCCCCCLQLPWRQLQPAQARGVRKADRTRLALSGIEGAAIPDQTVCMLIFLHCEGPRGTARWEGVCGKAPCQPAPRHAAHHLPPLPLAGRKVGLRGTLRVEGAWTIPGFSGRAAEPWPKPDDRRRIRQRQAIRYEGHAGAAPGLPRVAGPKVESRRRGPKWKWLGGSLPKHLPHQLAHAAANVTLTGQGRRAAR